MHSLFVQKMSATVFTPVASVRVTPCRTSELVSIRAAAAPWRTDWELVSVNKVNLRRTRLVLGWAAVSACHQSLK